MLRITVNHIPNLKISLHVTTPGWQEKSLQAALQFFTKHYNAYDPEK